MNSPFVFDSLEEAPTREEGGREVVNFRVVYKKETLSISFELDQPVSKLKSYMHELTGSVHEVGGAMEWMEGACFGGCIYVCMQQLSMTLLQRH